MGVAGDIFVASRRRCEDIDFRLAPRSPRQDPPALLPIRVVQVTSFCSAVGSPQLKLEKDRNIVFGATVVGVFNRRQGTVESNVSDCSLLLCEPYQARVEGPAMMKPITLARRFAGSLDDEDYASTAACLAPNCRYEIAGTAHLGPEAVIGSYREHGDWAARTLDDVQYESKVCSAQQGGIIVEFSDHVKHAGVAHTYRCEQRLEFDGRGLISSITHVDVPGEQEALAQFFHSVGLSRPNR